MDVDCPSLPPKKLVGSKPKPRPHQAVRIFALGCRLAVCCLCVRPIMCLSFSFALTSTHSRERSCIK